MLTLAVVALALFVVSRSAGAPPRLVLTPAPPSGTPAPSPASSGGYSRKWLLTLVDGSNSQPAITRFFELAGVATRCRWVSTDPSGACMFEVTDPDIEGTVKAIVFYREGQSGEFAPVVSCVPA